MAGIGGQQYARQHVQATLNTLSDMPLGPGDLVFVSAFAAPEDGPYAERARTQGVAALTANEVEDQVDELMAGARRAGGPGVRVARYDIEEFLY
jgi:hypothetical protein